MTVTTVHTHGRKYTLKKSNYQEWQAGGYCWEHAQLDPETREPACKVMQRTKKWHKAHRVAEYSGPDIGTYDADYGVCMSTDACFRQTCRVLHHLSLMMIDEVDLNLH